MLLVLLFVFWFLFTFWSFLFFLSFFHSFFFHSSFSFLFFLAFSNKIKNIKDILCFPSLCGPHTNYNRFLFLGQWISCLSWSWFFSFFFLLSFSLFLFSFLILTFLFSCSSLSLFPKFCSLPFLSPLSLLSLVFFLSRRSSIFVEDNYLELYLDFICCSSDFFWALCLSFRSGFISSLFSSLSFSPFFWLSFSSFFSLSCRISNIFLDSHHCLWELTMLHVLSHVFLFSPFSTHLFFLLLYEFPLFFLSLLIAQPFYLRNYIVIPIGGFFPFSAVFFEVFFLLSSILLHQYFTVFGFLW